MTQPFSLINQGAMHPLRLIAYTLIAWAALYLVAPVNMYTAPEVGPYLVFGGCILGAVLGLVAFEPRSLPVLSADPVDHARFLRRIYTIAFFLGAMGVALRTADWVFLRGVSVDMDFAGNREKLDEGGASVLSMLSTLLVPFTLAPYFIHALGRRAGLRIGSAWTGISLALLWPLLTIVIGSRSSAVMSLGMLFIARMLIYPRTPRWAIWICFIGGVGFLYVAGLIFLERIAQLGLPLQFVIQQSAFTHLVPVTQDYYTASAQASASGADTIFIVTTLAQYYLHGIPEFVYLVQHYGAGDQWGTYTFTTIDRLVHSLAGWTFDSHHALAITPRQGVYTTMAGPFYMDFGPLAPLACFLMGAVTSWTRRRVLMGDIGAVPLLIVLTLQMTFLIIGNLVSGAYGLFYDLAFVGFWIMCRACFKSPVRIAPQPPRTTQGLPKPAAAV